MLPLLWWKYMYRSPIVEDHREFDMWVSFEHHVDKLVNIGDHYTVVVCNSETKWFIKRQLPIVRETELLYLALSSSIFVLKTSIKIYFKSRSKI